MFLTVAVWVSILLALWVYSSTRARLQNWVLLIASYFIYALLDWQFLPLLWLATVVNFLIGRRLHSDSVRRNWMLYLGIAFNLGLLVTFKYANFFVERFSTLFNHDPLILNILLPLGISFYVFRLLSYLFDTFNMRINPSDVTWVEFALYIA